MPDSDTIIKFLQLAIIGVAYAAVGRWVYKRMSREFFGRGVATVAILGGRHKLQLTKHEEELATKCLVHPTELDAASFATIGGLTDAKTALRRSIVLPMRSAVARTTATTSGSSGGGAPSGSGIVGPTLAGVPAGVLLYGPPGTGKTLLARALAHELGCAFLAISPEHMLNKYVGESENLAAAVFSLARKVPGGCVIFIDEVDSILNARGTAMSTSDGTTTRVMTILMTHWDGLRSGASLGPVVVVAATNRPNALDEAVRRRLPVKVAVPMPDAEARENILNLLLAADSALANSDSERKDLARVLTPSLDGYSGSDLKELTRAALHVAMDEASEEANGAGAGDGRVRLLVRHFATAMKTVRPSGPFSNSQQQQQQQQQQARGGAAPRGGTGPSLD